MKSPIKPNLRVQARSEGSIGRVLVSGEIDLLTAPILRDALDGLIEAGVERIDVDMAEVGFLDSSGICVLVAGWRALGGRAGALRILRPQPFVAKVLGTTGLLEVFGVLQPETVEVARSTGTVIDR